MPRKDTCFLLLHGYGGGTFEVERLADRLKRRGYTAYTLTLHGHGGDRRQLAATRRQQWIAQVRGAYARLSRRYARVVVCGFSMGGLLAMHVEHPYAVILINVPVYLWSAKQIYRNLCRDFSVYARHYYTHTASKPLRSMMQFLLLRGEAMRRLGRVRCPCLILQAKDDDTCRHQSAEYLYAHVGSRDVRKMYYPAGGHDILRSHALPWVVDDILSFVEERL